MASRLEESTITGKTTQRVVGVEGVRPLTWKSVCRFQKGRVLEVNGLCTHVLISGDLVDELQLEKTELKEPTRMTLENGKKMQLTEMAEGLKCRTGGLYFKVSAIGASIPFRLISGQPSFHRERLL